MITRISHKIKSILFVGIAICIALTCSACTSISYEPKVIEDSIATFETKEDMMNFIQGSFVCLDKQQMSGKGSINYNERLEQIVIDGNKYSLVFYNAPGNYEVTETSKTISYYPSEGKFTIVSDISGKQSDMYILNNGSFVDHERYGDIRLANPPDSYYGFVRHDFISYAKFLDPFDTGKSKADQYETMYSALSFSEVKLTDNSSYSILTGKITNKGKKTYKYIKVKGLFKDKSGSVIDTDWTYGIGSEGLAPGESTSFRLSVQDDYRITKGSVQLFE